LAPEQGHGSIGSAKVNKFVIFEVVWRQTDVVSVSKTSAASTVFCSPVL
jgi:hypothetical protein